MMRRFNVAGLCVPGKHYMADLTERADRIIADYIDEGAYFTINRARQFGKTTLLHAIEERLKGRAFVISISFEASDDLFSSRNAFVNGFLRKTAHVLRLGGVDAGLLREWEEPVDDMFPFEALDSRITRLCSALGRDAVLMIDEVDKSSDNQIFLSFLGLLRSKYLLRSAGKDATFLSVILAGVYDVKNLKLKLRPDEERKYNSPWNIATDFDVDMSISAKGIEEMLREYSVDRDISMDCGEISRRIYFYTNGYPFLVSWLCKWIDERGGREWTAPNVENAEKALLAGDNILFDDLIKNVENNRELRELLAGILVDGRKLPCVRSDPVINLGMQLGVLAERDHFVCVSNIIFESYLYNHMIVGRLRERACYEDEDSRFVEGGQLNMERVLRKFQEVMRAE